MKTNETINKVLDFKDYYNSLGKDDRMALRHLVVPAYMQYPTFYQKLAKNSWTALEIEKLEMLTGEKFSRNDTTQY